MAEQLAHGRRGREVGELQRDVEVVVPHGLDRGLEVVAFLTAHTQLVALHLVLDTLEVEALEELSDLARLVGRDPHPQRDGLAHSALVASSTCRSRGPAATPAAHELPRAPG
jgi:hypothetical protein